MRIMYVGNDGSLFVDEVATMNLTKSVSIGDTDDIEGLFIESTDMNGDDALIILEPSEYDTVVGLFEDAFYRGVLNINAMDIDYYVIFNPGNEDYDTVQHYVKELSTL